MRGYVPSKSATEPSKVDERGRTILPPNVRKALGLEKGGHVVYDVKGDEVRVHSVEWKPRAKRPSA
jgi:bifunctional DNA-binding transcriptional regulator/antitoxin component of YhaV-PrlF toxin-antitoxin module